MTQPATPSTKPPSFWGRLLGRLGPTWGKRLLQTPIVLLVLVTLSFFLMRLAPGGPFSGEKPLHASTEQALKEKFRLDKSLPEQYVAYLGDLLQGDFGPSFVVEDRSVNELIAAYLPASLLLGGCAMLLALAIGITCGAFAALWRNGTLDHSLMTLIMLGVSIPNFVIAPILQICFSTWLDLLPLAGYQGFTNPLYLVLPAVTLAAPFAARIAGLTRAGMLEILNQDFIRTARAKGLSPARITLVHALPGALVPVMGFLGPAVASILTGSLVVEKIFAIPGLGREFVEAATNRDYTLVLGTVIVYGVILVVANLLADIGLALLDPRVKHER